VTQKAAANKTGQYGFFNLGRPRRATNGLPGQKAVNAGRLERGICPRWRAKAGRGEVVSSGWKLSGPEQFGGARCRHRARMGCDGALAGRASGYSDEISFSQRASLSRIFWKN
jgi:hypothetical protein